MLDTACIVPHVSSLICRKRIGAVKRQGPSSLPVRPQREADILRRLSSRHILPSLDIGHIWRAILNSSAQIQRPHSLVLWAPPEARLALLDLATRVYGVGITRHWAESRAQAVAEARAGQAIALVAWTGELDTPIDGLPTLMSLWPRLQGASEVHAEVLRNGQPVSLSVSLR